MTASQQFPYIARAANLKAASLVPMVPITLLAKNSLTAAGLLDTGAAINVLPYSSGLTLGLNWEEQSTPVQLSGNLSISEARAVLVTGVLGNFAPVRLAFAWAKTDAIPIILGQVNFFMEYDVCFYRTRQTFEIRPAAQPA